MIQVNIKMAYFDAIDFSKCMTLTESRPTDMTDAKCPHLLHKEYIYMKGNK